MSFEYWHILFSVYCLSTIMYKKRWIHLSNLLGAVVGSVACPLCKRATLIWHILSWKSFPSFADSRRASCQLLVKEW